VELHNFNAPLTADAVESPIVNYGGGISSINFLTSDDRWGRVTFEKLDSIRVSRGEHSPYPHAASNKGYSWVSIVSDSRWLKERYDYEKRYYGISYEFGGTVEEMLSDYSHYVFTFHDQFVEVLCSGIWFESADTNLGSREPDSDHPLLKLPESTIAERFQAHGIVCQVRRNPLSMPELENNAKYCSQTLLEIATELDGRVSTDWTLTLRVRNGENKIALRSYFGKEVEIFKSVPSLGSLRPRIDAWLAEVHERRVKMGKA
jgi:hypothetical protein